MKFSDLVVLGSTIINLDSTMYLSDCSGCLIGMAYAASCGCVPEYASSLDIKQKFPWLWEERGAIKCPVCGTGYHRYSAVLSCLCAHVEHQDVSFQYALDYISTIEPKEESGGNEDGLSIGNGSTPHIDAIRSGV